MASLLVYGSVPGSLGSVTTEEPAGEGASFSVNGFMVCQILLITETFPTEITRKCFFFVLLSDMGCQVLHHLPALSAGSLLSVDPLFVFGDRSVQTSVHVTTFLANVRTSLPSTTFPLFERSSLSKLFHVSLDETLNDGALDVTTAFLCTFLLLLKTAIFSDPSLQFFQ